jgi:ketosteroid isomerase-like protein
VTSEAVETATAAYRAASAGNADRVRELFAAEAEWHNTAVFPGERVWRGPEGVLDFWRTLSEDFDAGGGEIELELERDGRVALGVHSWGQGRTSGAAVDVHWAAVFTVCDDCVTRVDVYGSWDRALEALGG